MSMLCSHFFARQVCKNLVLSGIGITILDEAVVTQRDVGGAQFFLKAEDIGKNVRKSVYLYIFCFASVAYSREMPFFQSTVREY